MAVERDAAFFHRRDYADKSRRGQHDSRRRLGDIGCGRNRDAHLRLPQRRRIVGPVAAHADDVAGFLKRLYEFEFIFRQHASKHGETFRANVGWDWPGWTHRAIKSDGMSDNCRCRGYIASYHDHADAKGFQLRDQFCRVFAGRIAERDQSHELHCRRRSCGDGQHTKTFSFQFRRRLRRRR